MSYQGDPNIFVAVEFEKNGDENPEIEVIPGNSINEIHMRAYWPPYSEKNQQGKDKILKAISSKAEPKDDWLDFPITKILKSTGTYRVFIINSYHVRMFEILL